MEALEPEDDPPVLPRTLDAGGATFSGEVTPQPLEEAQQTSALRTSRASFDQLPAFQEVFMQMQALHLKLRDTHEAAIFHLRRNRATQSVASVESRMPMYGSTSISGLGSQALRSRDLVESRLGCMDSQNSGAFRNSRSSQNFGKAAGLPGCLEGAEDLKSQESSGSSAGFAGRLVRRARKATDKIDDKIEADGDIDSAFQLREEWDFSDEKLQDLKRIQKRMSASSITNPSLSHKRTDTGDRHRRKTRTMLPWYVVHPNARIKMVWDTLAIFAICLEICVSPLLLYRLTEMERSIADIFQWTLTAFWTLDIIASFFTATYVNDNLCFRLAEIAKAYLKSWFLFDITMLIPDFVGMAFDLEDGPAGIFRLLKARRILRLFRFVMLCPDTESQEVAGQVPNSSIQDAGGYWSIGNTSSICNSSSGASCPCVGKLVVCRGGHRKGLGQSGGSAYCRSRQANFKEP